MVYLLIEIKLKTKLGKFNTDDKVMEGVDLTIPKPSILYCDLLAMATGEHVLCD